MEFIIPKTQLSEAISFVSKFIPSRPPLTILSSILLKAHEHGLTIIATDLVQSIQVEIPCNVITPGKIAVPGKLFSDLINKLHGELRVFLGNNSDWENSNLIIEPPQGKYEIRVYNPDEFPNLPIVPTTNTIVISKQTLIDGFKVNFCTSSDETKYILTGLNISTDSKSIKFAATDGHRLAVSMIDKGTLSDIQCTIPNRCIKEILKIIQINNTDTINIDIDKTHIVFNIGHITIVTRILDDSFPKYQMLIPSEFNRKVVLDKKAFISSLDKMMAIAIAHNHVVKLDIANSSLTLSCEARDVGKAIEVIPSQITGENITLAYNIKYLIEGLKELPSNEVILSINQPLQPTLLTPLSNSGFTYLLMPIQVRN